MPAEPVKIVVQAPHHAFAKIGRHLFPDALGPGPVNVSAGLSPDFPAARVSVLAQIEDGAVVDVTPPLEQVVEAALAAIDQRRGVSSPPR